MNKMFYKVIFITLGAFLVLFLVFDSYQLYKKNKTGLSEIPLEYSSLKMNFTLSLLENQLELDSVYVFSMNDSCGIYNLVDSISEPTLIFRFSGAMCDQCIYFVIDKIKKEFVDFDVNNKIVFLSSDIGNRSKQFFEKPILTLVSEFSGSLEHENIPYLFVLGKDHSKQFVFVPDKSCPLLTEKYLKIVRQRFF